MKKLVKLQVRNIFHNKLFYVCLILTLLTTNVITFLVSLFGKNAQTATVCSQIINLFNSEVSIIGMLFITIFCTFDFSEGTTKNIIGRGYSRIKLLISKYIGSFIGIITIDLISVIFIFLLYAKNGIGWDPSIGLVIPFSIIKIIAFITIYATIAFVFEKTSIAIVTNTVLPNMITLLFGMSDTNLHTHMSKYWIENVGEKFASKATIANMGFPLIMYVIYIVLFVGVGMYLTNKKDIK
ncbi:MAG: hypothetical protein IKG58_03815 [Bacilli bacterium]|nr:hypothetical protein [Bacilli bacterium]MBR3049663.1 hypothetical protein [Bacilli bacterium]